MNSSRWREAPHALLGRLLLASHANTAEGKDVATIWRICFVARPARIDLRMEMNVERTEPSDPQARVATRLFRGAIIGVVWIVSTIWLWIFLGHPWQCNHPCPLAFRAFASMIFLFPHPTPLNFLFSFTPTCVFRRWMKLRTTTIYYHQSTVGTVKQQNYSPSFMWIRV
jgi:hypothetical protein